MDHKYQKLGVLKFGRRLLETGDLDPVYIMLHDSCLHPNLMRRWLLAYWFFYHTGVASHLAERRGEEFYREAIQLAKPESKTPRGAERRHFRGKACVRSISYFQKEYPRPEDAISALCDKFRGKQVSQVVEFVKKRWPLFGPWIGFKIADMLERLELARIEFPVNALEMYSEPTEGAKLVAEAKSWKGGVSQVVRKLEKKFSNFAAPPRFERKINAQEVETILCKWKSHLNGHYPVGKDTREIREALRGWGGLARELKGNLPGEYYRQSSRRFL